MHNALYVQNLTTPAWPLGLLMRRASKRVQPRPQSFRGFPPPDILHVEKTPAMTSMGRNAHSVHAAEHTPQGSRATVKPGRSPA